MPLPVPRAAHSLRLAILAFSIAIAAMPASAQQRAGQAPPAASGSAQAAPEADIVVTGRAKPLTRRQIYDQAEALSGASRSYDENLARFLVPVCPGVSGFRRDAAEEIVDRIRRDAERIGAPLAQGKCSPNLTVVAVDDSREFLDHLAATQPRAFRLLGQAERTELLEQAGAARVLSQVLTIASNGRIIAPDETPPSVWGQSQRWYVNFRRVIVASVVVFDRKALIGMTLTQIADYAAVRGLAHLRSAKGDEAAATILGLFANDRRSPTQWTSFDIGLLRSIYLLRSDEPAVTKLLHVRRWAEKARQEAEISFDGKDSERGASPMGSQDR